MTIVIGMLRDNGLVMGADTEETAEDFKRSVTKLPSYTNSHGHALIIGGAGCECQIQTVTQALQDDFSDVESAVEIAKLLEKFRNTIKTHYKEHVLCWPSAIEREENDFSLLLGAVFRLGPKKVKSEHALCKLWISQRGMIRDARAHEAIGTGANYARTLLDDYLGMYSIQKAVMIAVYILHRVKRDTPYCGKESQLWSTKGSSVRPVFYEAVQQAEELFKRFDHFSVKNFFTTVSLEGNTQSDRFNEKDIASNFRVLRKQFRQLSESMAKY